MNQADLYKQYPRLSEVEQKILDAVRGEDDETVFLALKHIFGLAELKRDLRPRLDQAIAAAEKLEAEHPELFDGE
jgi:hypothetical protein